MGTYFYKQSDEEREHMFKIFKFINNSGGAALSPHINKIDNEYSSLKELFESSLQFEIRVTNEIYKILKTCRKRDDFASESFLQWFVTEQMGEEQKLRDIIEMINLM